MTTITTINIKALRVSEHAKRDRWTRITRCVEAVGGLGEVAFVCKSDRAKYAGNVVQIVTTTGLILVVDIDRNLLITGYLASMRTTMGLYGSAGYHRMPNYVYKTVAYNERHLSHLFGI